MKEYFNQKKDLSSKEEKDLCKVRDVLLDFIYFHNYVEKVDIKYLSVGGMESYSTVTAGKSHDIDEIDKSALKNATPNSGAKLWRKIGTRYDKMQSKKEDDVKTGKFHILNDYRPYCQILYSEKTINTGLKDRFERKFGAMKKIPVQQIENALHDLKYDGFLVENVEMVSGKVIGYDLTEKAKSFYESNNSFYSLYTESNFKKVGSRVSKWSLIIAIISFIASLIILSSANWDKIRVNIGIDEPRPQDVRIILDN